MCNRTIFAILFIVTGTHANAAVNNTCAIPPNVQIVAPDPCETWRWVERGWKTENDKMWVWGVLNEIMRKVENPYREFKPLNEVGPLRVEEVPGPWFWHPDGYGRIYGLFDDRGNPPTIRYAAEMKNVIPHELGHFLWWTYRDKFGPDVHPYIGHGGNQDPYWYMSQYLSGFFYCPFAGWGYCEEQP